MADERPIVVIVDGSVAVTGAVVSAARQAELLRDLVTTVLVLPRGHQVPAARLTAFAEVIDLRIVPLRKTATSLLTYLPALVVGTLRLRRELHRLGASRLQLNDFYLLHGVMLRLLGFRGRIVTWVRIDPRRYGKAGNFWLFAARRWSNSMVSVSKFIIACLPAEVKTTLIYEPSQIRAATEELRDPQAMLFVGNYIFGKGQEEAIRAFHQVADRFPAATLVFHGGDMGLEKNRAYLNGLRRQAAAGPGAERITFGPFLPDLADARGRAGIALNFSHSESFSLTCLEASASGLPVIATRCGGPEEIVEHGVTGHLVPVGDVSAMAEAMKTLLVDPDRAARMGEAGRELVAERFSPVVIRDALVETLGLGASHNRPEQLDQPRRL